jgi:anti-sigma28 factor (negative regulator of flagellin synthesis)
MISGINSAALRSAYANNEVKSQSPKEGAQIISKQGDSSKIEALKASIENGEYKINLDKLASKIADELL